MSVTFFQPACQSQSNRRTFGICDDPPPDRSPAYLDETNGDTWIAVVHKGDDLLVTFTAIDYCIETRRPNGEMDNRCDGMLAYGDTVVFVELKERNTDRTTWVAQGEKQLRTSIAYFQATEAAATFTQKLAYLANSERPKFNDSNRNRKGQFFADTGYVLEITPHIHL